MTSITFDTHLHIKRLKEKGFTEPQAESVVDMVREAQDNHGVSFAGKEDILLLRSDLRELELRMTVKTGTMLIALGGFLAAIKYFA